MATLTIKGVTIGAGRPKTIVPLLARDAAQLLELARGAVSAGADCVEWRVDFLGGSLDDPLDLAAVAHAGQALAAALPHTPVIATVRTASQGGQVELDAGSYCAVVRALIESGAPDLVDVELGIGDASVLLLAAAARDAGMPTVVSHHDFQGTPPADQMQRTLEHMDDLGASIPKLAVMAHGPLDALALMQATAQAAARINKPLLTMAMGHHGAITRLAGETFGSALTFCSLGTPSAPGQVELAQAQALMGNLHDVLREDAYNMRPQP